MRTVQKEGPSVSPRAGQDTSAMRSLIVQKCLFCFFKRYFILGVCIFESAWGSVHNSAGIAGAGVGVTRCWEQSPSPQQKLPIFSRTETSLQPPNLIFSRIFYVCMAH